VLRELGGTQQLIAKLAATVLTPATAAPMTGGIDPLLALKTDAARLPQPLGRWLTEIATSAVALRSGDPRLQLATIFNASGGPAELCPAVVNGHYPFTPTTDDVAIDDFARLFAPGGAIDGFVNTLLLRYVDTSGKTWRLISADAASAPVSAADLAQFQRAAMIRDVFFADGGTRPRFRLNITPVSVDTATRQVTLDLDGTTIIYTHDAPRSTQVTWPSFSLQPTMRLVFEPPPGELRETGPWALFRLFALGRMQAVPGTTDRYTLTFQFGARQAVFDLRVQASGNPFTPGLLQDFHCPSVRAN
jgi:type VI secretion system protein ImpL